MATARMTPNRGGGNPRGRGGRGGRKPTQASSSKESANITYDQDQAQAQAASRKRKNEYGESSTPKKLNARNAPSPYKNAPTPLETAGNAPKAPTIVNNHPVDQDKLAELFSNSKKRNAKLTLGTISDAFRDRYVPKPQAQTARQASVTAPPAPVTPNRPATGTPQPTKQNTPAAPAPEPIEAQLTYAAYGGHAVPAQSQTAPSDSKTSGHINESWVKYNIQCSEREAMDNAKSLRKYDTDNSLLHWSEAELARAYQDGYDLSSMQESSPRAHSYGLIPVKTAGLYGLPSSYFPAQLARALPQCAPAVSGRSSPYKLREDNPPPTEQEHSREEEEVHHADELDKARSGKRPAEPEKHNQGQRQSQNEPVFLGKLDRDAKIGVFVDENGHRWLKKPCLPCTISLASGKGNGACPAPASDKSSRCAWCHKQGHKCEAVPDELQELAGNMYICQLHGTEQEFKAACDEYRPKATRYKQKAQEARVQAKAVDNDLESGQEEDQEAQEEYWIPRSKHSIGSRVYDNKQAPAESPLSSPSIQAGQASHGLQLPPYRPDVDAAEIFDDYRVSYRGRTFTGVSSFREFVRQRSRRKILEHVSKIVDHVINIIAVGAIPGLTDVEEEG
ncbi:hypothetical protein PTMSG1_06948 [Pyrenophora teres f. maculata]|nr:hypothetical protein PTMSG1_06948 [Pyrenophora teres f. maculata]